MYSGGITWGISLLISFRGSLEAMAKPLPPANHRNVRLDILDIGCLRQRAERQVNANEQAPQQQTNDTREGRRARVLQKKTLLSSNRLAGHVNRQQKKVAWLTKQMLDIDF
jgi:hypothetical protein